MADLDAARRALTDALGADAVLADPLSLRLYARDASLVEGNASVVVLPTSVEQIQDAVRIAAAHGLPIVPRGSGTGLAGAATPIGDALVVVTAKMNRILEVRTEDRLAWVEPGLFNLDLSTALAPLGWTYAPDPSSQQVSSIGGNVNTNAGGPHCLAYGVTSAHVLAVDIVLPDGDARPARLRGARGRRLRPPRRGGRERGHARCRGPRLRAPHADPARRPHDAARLRGGRGLRGDRLRHHRARA